jgi:hypothetical protein
VGSCSDVRPRVKGTPQVLLRRIRAPEPERRRLKLPLNILLRELAESSSPSGRGRFAVGGGFGSVDGPGFDVEAGGGWLSVGPGVG